MLKVGTDFTGIGAPEMALKELGIPHEVEFACEKDKYARQTYEANHSAKIMYPDIKLRDHAAAPYCDIYFSGFPCQSFSQAGKRLGFEDIRGTYFFDSADYIRTHLPPVFVFENVTGLLTHDKPKGSKAKYGRTFSTIINVLAKTVNGQLNFGMYDDNLGYHVYHTVLNSKYFDVPQNRERVFIVGFRDEVNFRFPFSNKVTKRLADILEENVDEKYYLSAGMISYLTKHKEEHEAKGNGFGFAPKSRGDIANTVRAMKPDCPTDTYIAEPAAEEIANCLRANGALNSTDNILAEPVLHITEATKKGYAVASAGDSVNISQSHEATRRGTVGKKIAQTVKTSPNQAVVVINGHYARLRRLTPLECMRLQGFPDTFIKQSDLRKDGNSQAYKQAGNSIPVPVIKAIIKNALEAAKLI